MIILLTPGFFTVRESPLWLIRQGRFRQAVIVFKEVARINSKGDTCDAIIEELESELESKNLDQSGFENPNEKMNLVMRLKLIVDDNNNLKSLIILSLVSAAQYCMYYGISSSVQEMGFEKIQFNGIVTGLTQGLGYIIVLPMVSKTPRKFALIAIQGILLCGAGILLALSLIPDFYLNRLLQGLIANILISCAISTMFSFAYLANAESFPPQIRGLCCGTILLLGKIVGSTAPYISHRTKEMGLHVLVGCALPMIPSFLLTLGLRETLTKTD